MIRGVKINQDHSASNKAACAEVVMNMIKLNGISQMTGYIFIVPERSF